MNSTQPHVFNSFLFEKTPDLYLPFKKVKDAYPKIRYGECIADKKKHNYWTFYLPQTKGEYRVYYLKTTDNPYSLFYFKNKIKTPVVFKPNNTKLVEYFKSQIQALPKPTITDKNWSFEVMQHIKSYFLAPYLEGTSRNRAKRKIKGILHVVERYNHGLAHGLRQGALAKDILEALVCLNESKDQGVKDFYAWASERIQDKNFIKKLELASAFQRSGRQSEVSSAANLELYKKFERQDALNFRIAAQKTGLFKDLQEIKIFEEAILWSNKGELDENQLTDLKYIRRILHCAHTFDLRRLTSFCGNRIQQDAMDQLFGKRVDLSDGSPYEKLSTVLWKRSGEYLKATGDRDLVDKRPLENSFFTQSKHPIRLVLAIEAVKARLINPNYRRTQNSDASPAGFRTNVQ